MDTRAIAVWYGDDGTYAGHHSRWGHGKAMLCNKSLVGEARPRVQEKFVELGIGRPSTYATILSVLRDRAYVRMDRNRFLPEDKESH